MNIFNILSDVIFPPQCLFCNEYLGLGTRPLICKKCVSILGAYDGVHCNRCGTAFDYRDNLPYCNTCRSARHPFNGVISAYFYKDGVKQAIIEHKFSFNHNNAPVLADRISEIINEMFKNQKPDIAVTVPSSKRRLHDRGYDALLEIAEEISANCDIPLSGHALIKIKDTPQQSTLSGRARLRNVHGAFKVRDKSEIKGKTILLVDDVYTTGATTRECAKVLRRAGASYIIIATVAISETFRR